MRLAKKSRAADRIFSGAKRQHVVDRVMDVLRDWRLSEFENEGVVRAGLRSALCLKGHTWQRADDEAASVVAEGLGRLGATRPSWNAGQREYVVPRENCNYCRGDLDDYAMSRGDRFCCTECARHALTQRDYATRPWDDELGRRALYILQRSSMPTRECGHCSRSFQPSDLEAQFCSRRCRDSGRHDRVPDLNCLHCGKLFHPANRAILKFCSVECSAAGRRTLPDLECLNCRTPFRPRNSEQKFCCHECSTAYREAILPVKACVQCGDMFQPKHETSLFCSAKCNQRAKDARAKEKRLQRRELVPPRPCDNCSTPFRPGRRIDRFCCEQCQRQDSRRRLKAA